jgi:D-alanine-D-alanine ligase
MRVNKNNEVFVLELNANPDISPQAGFPAALQAAGIEFTDFIKSLITNAAERNRKGSATT